MIGLVQTAFVVVLLVLGMFVLSPVDAAVWTILVGLVAFGGSLALGIWMERALSSSIAESA